MSSPDDPGERILMDNYPPPPEGTPDLELINIVDDMIHGITRRHIPDYPEAQTALDKLTHLIYQRLIEARIDEQQRTDLSALSSFIVFTDNEGRTMSQQDRLKYLKELA